MINWESLNAEQRKAVEHLDGPLLVLAGAGSGKTRTLTYRIANLLEQGRVSPHGILALTFTRKAAWEMRRRLGELVGQAAEDITATTFHGLGYKLLSAEAGTLGYKPDKLIVFDAGEAQRLLQRAMQETNVNGASPRVDSRATAPASSRCDSHAAAQQRWNIETIVPLIERAKDNLYAPSDFVQVKGDFFEESIAQVYRRYQELLKEHNAVDYGDLIRLAVEILRIKQHPDILEFYQNLFRYVLVDEFQDSSFGQYQLLRHLVWQHRNLCCVGSPVQAIYSWRGADIHNILERFRADFPDAPMMVLSRNYRSTSNILAAAQAVVQDLPYREDLQTDNDQGASVIAVPLSSGHDEANFIANEIQRLNEEQYCAPNDCAVLFRTRSQGRLLEQVFLQRGISYILVGENKFFECREVKDILAYLRLIHNMFDASALQRIINRPPRGLGPAALQKLQRGEPELNFSSISGLHKRTDLPPKVQEAAIAFTDLLYDDLAFAVKAKHLSDFVNYILVQTGYRTWVEKDPDAKRRLANLRLLRAMTTRYDHDTTVTAENVGDVREQALGTFLADIAILSGSGSMSASEGGSSDLGLPTDAKGVTLATIHAVKGLEFPVVFLSGLEEGIFPHARALKTPQGIEEETRLAYVAMTRAMSLLYLTYAQSRMMGDEMKEHSPSRFLSAIPQELTQVISISDRRGIMAESEDSLHLVPSIAAERTAVPVPITES